MIDLSSLFISAAYAQDAAAPVAAQPSPLMSYVPLVLIFVIFYFLVIRPQQKKIEEQNRMIKALQRGDRVVFGGGIHGKIARLEGEDIAMIEIADGVTIKVERSQIAGLAAKTEPAKQEEPKA
jgi:preprotein translocase subunit YajC